MSRLSADAVLDWGSRACAAVSASVLLLIGGFLLLESAPALMTVGVERFFTDESWHPRPEAQDGQFNILPMLTATAACAAGAMLVSAPLGIGCAIFVQFFSPRLLVQPFRRLLELLTAIPSVVYGFWGLTALVPLINRFEPPGASLLAGILILALMILPTLALIVDSAIAALPKDLGLGAAALGLSAPATIVGLVLPAIRPAVATGILLQTGRALGETIAVLMVCGNVVQHPKGLFEPVRPLTSNIALEMAYAVGDHRSALFVSGLALLATVTLLAIAAEGAQWRPVKEPQT